MECQVLKLSDKASASIDRFLLRSPKNALAVGVLFHDKRCGCFLSEGITPQTRFDIGSISKTFTAQLILKLVDQGRLSLNDTVDRYLDLPKGKYPTIISLLTHTAGYRHLTPWEITVPALLTKGYTRANPYRKVDTADVISALSKRNHTKTHCSYGYSDFAYAVLAVVAEKVMEKPFHSMLEQLIREDYHLYHTEAYPTASRCSVYLGNKDIAPWYWDKNNPYIAGGGVVSTLEDMLQYAQIQLESDLPQVVEGHRCYSASFSEHSNIGTCLSWHTYKKSNQLWHVGGVGAFRSSIIINRHSGCAVVVLGNAKGGKSANIHYIAKLLYSELKRKHIGLQLKDLY